MGDVIDFMPYCTEQHTVDYCINEIVPIVLNNTQTFLDPLVAKHPNIKIVSFGYDLINFALNPLCRSLGLRLSMDARTEQSASMSKWSRFSIWELMKLRLFIRCSLPRLIYWDRCKMLKIIQGLAWRIR